MRTLLPVCMALAGCIKQAPPTLTPDNTLVYETEDGWVGEIRHYAGTGDPVLLVHGMGANHYNWDYRPEVSLAHHLQQQGWDVWVPELRGDPGATPPSRKALRSYTFDDHALLDLPAIVDTVLAVTGQERLHWVGHSMGGILLYTGLAQYPEKIASGVAICSPSTARALAERRPHLRSLRWLVAGNGRIPSRALARATLPLGKAHPLIGQVANPGNLDWNVAMGLARHALVDLPKPMARQAIGWSRSADITTVQGVPWIRPTPTPLLVMGAPADKVVAEPDAAYACSIFPDCQYYELSIEAGFSVDYGHVDTVLGQSAPREIYPLISAFLAAQGGSADSETD